MKLNKRYFRSIKSNLSFYISATVLTIMTLFLFFMMNIAGSAIWEFGDDFFETQNVEDANFTTYLPITEKEIKELEEEYSVNLEAQYYSNIETAGVTARVFKKTNDINLYSITVLEDGVILENIDKQGPSVRFAGTNRSTGTANTSVSLNPSDGNTIVVSMQKYDTANAQFVPMYSTSDAATVQSLMEQYSRLVTDEAATSGGEDDHSDKQIIVQYPDNYNSETGSIVYDGTEQTTEVWLMDETGTLVIADEAWYDITYEKWDESSSSWVPLSDGEVPTEAGTYRTVLTITEEGKAVNLKEENITQTSGIEFTIEPAQYTGEQVAAKDPVTVYVEYGTEVTIKNLFDNDKYQLFEVLPTGAEISIDEWDINVTFNSELNTYTLHYTVADKLENPNITVSGTIDVIVSLELSRDSFTYAAPHENAVLPEADNYNGAGQYLEYGMAIQGTGDVDLTVQYKLVGVDAQGNPFETDWRSDPFIVKDIGEYTIHYKIESAEGAYSGSYAFGIGKTQIGDYAEGLLDVQAQDKDGNTMEWDDVYTTSYDPGWIMVSKTAEKDGVYVTIETSDLMKERGWTLEYYIADGSEEPKWNVYDGSRILLKDEETLIRYRISGDDTLEDAFEQEIDIYLEPTMYYVNVVITEDGQIYIDGMKPGAEYSYTVYDETYDSDSGVRVENQVVGEDGKAWLDSSVFTNVYNYIELFARTYNTLEDGTKIPYEGFALSGQSIIPGAIADLVTGSSSTVKDDVVADAANPSGTIQMPETLPEGFKGYILMSYDEVTGTWSLLGPTTADGSIDSDAVFEALLNDTWSAEAYLDTLQDIYDANGNGLVSKHLKVMYIYDWLFEFGEYMTEEEAKQYFAEELKWYTEMASAETEGEGGSYVDLIYSVFLHEEGTENLKDLTIRIEYPDGSYEVYDDITGVPIRVYDYDGDYKLAKVVAIDAEGNEFELSEDLYYIVYEALSAEEAAAFALRQAGILPKEPAYYRATIHLTDIAKEQYGLSEENFENMMLVFAIANPDEEKLEDVLEETIADKVSMQITVRKDELVYPNAADAFGNLQDNQYVLVENWLSGISFHEDGTYEYTYKLYTAYEGIAPVCIEGTIVLEVDVLSNDIIVDGFEEDTVTADPEKTYELVVTPVDTKTGLTVEYSADGINWQTKRIPVSKPGTYVVYYRVKDYAGNVIESGKDSITITAIELPVETEVTSPDAKPTLSTNSYEGVLGDDNSFQVEMTVTEGNKEDYKLEYSVFIPISGSGASVTGYWSEYTTTPPELVEGENIVRIRVTNISDDAAYYEEYIRMYNFTMYPEDYIAEEDIDKSVVVKGFGEDAVEDPDIVHQLIVTPKDARANLKIDYSLDGVNWQTEVISISKAGDYTVYYRVHDTKGNLIQSGSDSITLFAASVEPVVSDDSEESADPDTMPESSDGAVNTGDNAEVSVWVLLMLISIAAAGWSIWRRRKYFR